MEWTNLTDLFTVLRRIWLDALSSHDLWENMDPTENIKSTKQRIVNNVPATSTAVHILNDVNSSSVQLWVVQLRDGILHVTECCKLRNPTS